MSVAWAIRLDGPVADTAARPPSEEQSAPEAQPAPVPEVDSALTPAQEEPAVTQVGGVSVVVIPVRDQIARPVLYIVRRGLKEAIEQKAHVVVLDMKTPGGRADVMLEIMEALDKFEGRTVTFVNDEAGSAGALIAAVTDDIYFSPKGVMGAAELITGTGADVPEALKRKMTSFLSAKIRAFSESHPRRAHVLEAMMDPNFELKIGDRVLKEKGKLLTLTAKEATEHLGEPPGPLLANGIAADLEELLQRKFGAGNYTKKELEITWSEGLASFLNSISPLLLGLGLFALFVEFKTPGFGFFGFGGIALLVIVFLGNFVAGLSGHEPLLVFALGVLLIVVEIFFVPGTVVLALTGVVMIFGALLWSMADIWPNEPLSFSWELLAQPLQTLVLGLLVATVFGVLLARFLPSGWFWTRLAVSGEVVGTGEPTVQIERGSLIGREAVAATDLFPSGQIEIEGRRFEARLEVGDAKAGTRVRVTRQTDFSLIVEVLS